MIAWLGNARILAPVILVSLAGNFFLSGLLLGRNTGETVHGSQTKRSIQAMIAPLPAAKRQLVRREINAVLPTVRQQFEALKAARAALAEEMTAAAPDSGALERGFAAVQTHSMMIRAEFQKAIVRALPGLSQDERRALVNALARRQSGSALP